MSVYIPVALRREIEARFNHCCAYCHTAERLVAATFEVEHIVPLAAGGETVLDNLCISCPMCNRYKSVRQTAVDPQTNLTVPLFHPQQNEWVEHFAWNEDSSELVRVRKCG